MHYCVYAMCMNMKILCTIHFCMPFKLAAILKLTKKKTETNKPALDRR